MNEAVHTRHKNHGKAFWRELDRIVGNGKALQRSSRTYHPHAEAPAVAE